MKLKKRHKYIVIALSIYWPVLFTLTHIPVPQLARQSGMSDKTMHFMAYLLLTFMLWFTFNPYQKPNWKRYPVWLILVVVAWYSVIDEFLQHLVGRSADVRDFYANLCGTIACLLIISFFSFWPALLLISSLIIFMVTNLSSVSTICSNVFINAAFHFIAYASVTLIWIEFMHRWLMKKKITTTWFLLSLMLPCSLLTVVKISSLFLDKKVWPIDIYTAMAGIVSAVVVSAGVLLTGAKKKL